MRDFNGVIVFLSILCPKNFTRVKKKFDLSGGGLQIFRSEVFGDIVSKNIEHFFFSL